MSADVHLLGLLALPGMGPARLGALLRQHDPETIWTALVDGRQRRELASWAGTHAAVVDPWVSAARLADLSDLAQRYEAARIGVARLGHAGYPPALVEDPEPPVVLFSRGDEAVVERHRAVAIVGTRSCTRYGVEIARELGQRLAEAGVSIVSGLAVGIDAAAHAGALSADAAPPVGVVGSGLDVVYPRANTGLWQQVASKGLLLSESPLGARPERWRFPARNRIIAGLAELVVVVESHHSGGSLSTVDEALERDVQVMAVPGSILSPASTGTNRLIADGSMPVCDTADVLEVMGFDVGGPDQPTVGAPGDDDRLSTEQAVVLDALAWQPASLQLLSDRTDMAHGTLALALERLESAGWVERRGLFYERVQGSARRSDPLGGG